MPALLAPSRLPAARLHLLLHAAALVAMIRLALCVLPLRRMLGLTALLGRPPRHYRSAPPAERDLVSAVAAVSGWVPASTCLVRGLAVVALLARHGYQAQLCVGVAHAASGRLAGHAWVERHGRTIFGDVGSRYVRLSLPWPGRCGGR